MLDRLEHRGPDDSGTLEIGGNWLGHRRLSIVDVEGGHQPLRLADSSAFLVGNGEIYNHLGLRRLLAGRQLLTRSDNEVALHLVDRDGPSSLARLNGMFALVFAAQDGRFVAARDPVGIKPLYWARRGDTVRFASELHAFDPSWQEAVEPFPPGCAWTPQGGLQRFASAVPAAGTGPAPANPIRGTRDVLVDAVQRQMMGDVPVGVFLSGGLDSSLVAAIASRYLADKGDQLQTFAVGTPDSPDIAAAREIAAFIGSAHHEILYDADEALGALDGVVRCIESFDPALVRSAVPNYLLARETVKHVKVVLTGEGADELFAGYSYMREFDDDADALHDELERTIDGLHNLNLQRADRVTMAHSLEARVPFLDREVIAWSMRLPAALKIPGTDEMEKQLLREAFAGWLPEHLLWRVKAQFGDGSGARDVLSDAIVVDITDEQFEAERTAVDPPLRTKEELAYYRVWRAWLPDVDPTKTLTRFATA
ncbi:MAG: asparagine synthase (glutamine-hydrolyzing) [Jatrophihabitans endophyticus]|nr:asparagine synthase (glutamine-hydrolyzing) [Jatrophihabitans endophyticus]